MGQSRDHSRRPERREAYLGIGAAWNEEESLGLGFPMPPLGVRFEMLDETLQIVHQMWRESAAQGNHSRASTTSRAAAQLAAGAQQAAPQDHHGGGGEQKTLRLVAKYADACNIFGGPAQLTHKFAVLRERCAEIGRPYEEIERTNLAHVDLAQQTPAQIVDGFAALAEVGVQHVIFNLAGVDGRTQY